LIKTMISLNFFPISGQRRTPKPLRIETVKFQGQSIPPLP